MWAKATAHEGTHSLLETSGPASASAVLVPCVSLRGIMASTAAWCENRAASFRVVLAPNIPTERGACVMRISTCRRVSTLKMNRAHTRASKGTLHYLVMLEVVLLEAEASSTSILWR